MSGRNRSGPRHKRPLIGASFVVLLLLTATAFAATGVGYFATEKAKGDAVVGTVTDYRVDETAEPAEIVVEVEVENPTRKSVTVDSAVVNGQVDGSTIAKGSSVVSETIPPGESATITVRMTALQDDEAAMIEAARNGSMTFSGSMWARIERSRFQLNVPPSDGGEES